MTHLPITHDAIVLRTWFGDELAWKALCAAIRKPAEFVANVEFVDDPAFSGLSATEALELASRDPHSCLFIADEQAQTAEGHPVLVMALKGQRGRTFRVIVSELWGVENNLSLANMDFEEFADNVDADGVFRGF